MLSVMVLLGGLLHTWLLLGICRSVIADDPDFSQFFSPEIIDGDGTELALGLDPASITFNSLDSNLFAQTDPADSEGGNSALDLFSTTDPSDELFIGDTFSPDLIAGSDVGCVSYEGQPISRIRRDNLCVDDSLIGTPAPAAQAPKEGTDATFPPIGSNLERLPGRRNDPKPRRRTDTNAALNTEEDFKFCPSGVNGYRQYAVCDSGLEQNRHPGVSYHDWSLWDVSHCRCTPGFFLLRRDQLMTAGSAESNF